MARGSTRAPVLQGRIYVGTAPRKAYLPFVGPAPRPHQQAPGAPGLAVERRPRPASCPGEPRTWPRPRARSRARRGGAETWRVDRIDGHRYTQGTYPDPRSHFWRCMTRRTTGKKKIRFSSGEQIRLSSFCCTAGERPAQSRCREVLADALIGRRARMPAVDWLTMRSSLAA